MLAHTITGQGPALVLIHGFCEDRTLWNNYALELSKRFTVICPDLPGFGDSAPEFAEAVTMEYYAKRVHELLDTILGNDERAVLVGHSLGGYVALAFADLYPERINGIGLFHSTAFADNEEKKVSRDKVAAYIQQKGVAAFTDNFIEPLFYVANRERLMPAIEQLKKQAALSSKEGVIAAIMGMKERLERIDVLKKLECPVLYIIGKSDTSVTIDKSLEQCHLAAQSLVFVLDKVGHMGMLEEEEKCLTVLGSFAHLCSPVKK
jgi:pimeloyl-ACP methyl ester carboxylesterase